MPVIFFNINDCRDEEAAHADHQIQKTCDPKPGLVAGRIGYRSGWVKFLPSFYFSRFCQRRFQRVTVDVVYSHHADPHLDRDFLNGCHFIISLYLRGW